MKDTPISLRFFDHEGKGLIELPLLEPRTREALEEIALKLKPELSMDVIGRRSIMARRVKNSTVLEWLL